MRSHVLSSKQAFQDWCNKHSTFGVMEPTHYPCVVVADAMMTLLCIVYYSEFQDARYQRIKDEPRP